MIDFLYSIDTTILYFFNHTLSNPAFDRFFSTITNVNNWYISYIILWCICFFKGGRNGKLAAIGIIFLIAVGDQFGNNMLKNLIERIRPCGQLQDVLTPLGCNGTYAFPSGHALNNFAAATFFYLFFPKYKWIFFITAFLIALSRVYLGLHYPSDIIGGAIIGILLGYTFYQLLIFLDKRFLQNLLSKSESKESL